MIQPTASSLMQTGYILGIDIGTGSTKAVAVAVSGEPLFTSQAYYPIHQPQQGYSEQDPETIWIAFIKCINEVLLELEAAPLAISLSSAMHSVIPVNEAGTVLYPMLTWADGRSASIAENIRAGEHGEELYRVSGTPVYAMSPLAKIIWFRENLNTIFKDTMRFISIKEYIWYKLFGAFEVDYSIASGSGLFDIIHLKWNPEALAMAGIDETKLSQPVATGYCRSHLRQVVPGLLLSPDTCFVIGGSDGVLANLGSLVIDPGIAALTIGTSGAVRITRDAPIYNFRAMTFNYRLDEQLFVCGGPVNNGGIAIQWLLKNLQGKTDLKDADYDKLFDEIKLTEPGSSGLLFLPYLAGERAPVWDTDACGVFFGIRLQHTAAHFARAVLEGICYALHQVLEALDEAAVSSTAIRQINVSGGFVHSSTWIKVLADITGKRICLLQQADASATGAAFLAMKSLGIINDYSSLVTNTRHSFIEPDKANHEIYKKNFLIFKELYPRLKDCMHHLHNDN